MDGFHTTTTSPIEDMLDGVFEELKAYEQSDTFKAIAAEQETRQRAAWAKATHAYNLRYPLARRIRAEAQPFRDALYHRQGGACYLCSKELGDDIQIDHIIPVSKGGRSESSNLCMVHSSCNGHKGAHVALSGAGSDGDVLTWN